MARHIVNLREISLDDFPQKKSVYAISARSKKTLRPVNCRYVGETENLQESLKTHFRDNEKNECLKDFMQSSKTKMVIFELLPNFDKSERFVKEEEWKDEFDPKCNKD